METLAVGLLLIGIVLLIVEVILPGFGVPGILGILSSLSGICLIALYVPLGPYVLIGIAIGFVILSMVLWRILKNKQLYSKIILNDVLAKEPAEIADIEHLIGKEGYTVTSLRPFGKVDFNGLTLEVYSNSAYVAENKKVRVTDVESNKIFVKEING